MNELKLNNKRTILVGLAFLSISAFWQMYDNVIQMILGNTFHLNETVSGAIMAADNVLALFLLPFFGGLSDRTRNEKLGRRTPYILAGTAAAVILMNLLPILDNSYAREAAPFKFASFVVVLGLLLVAMGYYRSPEEIELWVELAKRYLEVPELLAFSEHAMYIGEMPS